MVNKVIEAKKRNLEIIRDYVKKAKRKGVEKEYLIARVSVELGYTQRKAKEHIEMLIAGRYFEEKNGRLRSIETKK